MPCISEMLLLGPIQGNVFLSFDKSQMEFLSKILNTYSIYDDIETLRNYGIDMKYMNINNIPNEKNKWIKIIDNKYKIIYQDELSKFKTKIGKLFFKLNNDVDILIIR